jgi:hypothetical protein
MRDHNFMHDGQSKASSMPLPTHKLEDGRFVVDDQGQVGGHGLVIGGL